MKPNKKGFTLVEIMSGVAIIGLLSALALPNLLRARVNANEATAQVTLKAIHTALTSYNFVQAPPSYPSNLADLANANPPYLVPQVTDNSATTFRGAFLNVSLFQGYKGYVFRYEPTFVGSNVYDYRIYALPVEQNQTGSRYFLLSAAGDILEVDKDTATGFPGGSQQ